MSNKYTVLIIGKLPPPYMGPSIALEILIRSGLKDNFNLLHLDVKANKSLNTLGKWSFEKILKNFSIYLRLASLLKKNRPDVVLVPISQSALGFIKDAVYIVICKIYRRKVMIQLRGSNFKTWINNSNFLLKFFVKIIFFIPTGVIVQGNNLRHIFENYFDAPKIFVVPNGANYNLPERYYNRSLPVKLIYLGNLQPSKGIEDVIEALKIVNKKAPGSFEMTIIGEWRKKETKEKCIHIIEENNLPVTIHSSRVSEKKFNYLLNSDIFIFTPREPEGHPWVIVEALASGLPIISTNRGAIIESVIDGENGFIVNIQQPYEIAERLLHLINDPDLRIGMGLKSRERYLTYFTEDVMVTNFTNAFLAVIQPQPSVKQPLLQD